MGRAIRGHQKMYNVVRYSLTFGGGKSKGDFDRRGEDVLKGRRECGKMGKTMKGNKEGKVGKSG